MDMLGPWSPSTYEIRPAAIHANTIEIPDAPFDMPPHPTDEKGRMKMPAYLLTAHKSG